MRSSATASHQAKSVGLEVARVAAQRLGIARDVDDPAARADGGGQVEAVGALARRIEDDGVGRIGRRARRPGRGGDVSAAALDRRRIAVAGEHAPSPRP